ncbi:hypothetical protein J578_3201 [Acinetobacter baumannii 1552865]|nr:hypothetical protein J578_3201 [Acinetobacter baumannii 1552865]
MQPLRYQYNTAKECTKAERQGQYRNGKAPMPKDFDIHHGVLIGEFPYQEHHKANGGS